MRSLPVAVLSLVFAAACGEVAPLAVDAAPTCEPACGAHATCSGTTCACDTGWEGNGLTCTDTDECATNNGGCDPNAACFNTDGSRNCGCNTGYVGDGLTCRRVWTPRGTAQIRLSNIINGQTNDANAVAVGNRLYFAPDIGGDGDVSNHFLKYFDIQTMQFNTGTLAIPPAGTSDFCACGYTEVFVSDGTDIFMFGNDGYRYRVAQNQWVALSTYTPALARGESAGAFEGNNSTIYMIGGRGPLDTAQRYSPVANSFTTEPGTLPFAVDSARAWAPPGNNLVYVAGGTWSDNNRQHLYRHATGTSTWTALADAPISLSGMTGMGDFQGKIWVSTRQQMAFYDPAANTWSAPMPVPGGFVLAVTAGSRTFAFVQSGDTLEIQELTAIE